MGQPAIQPPPFEIGAVTEVESFDDNLTPGSKATCPDCGKLLTVTQAGALRSHKCVGDVSTGTGKSGKIRTPQKAPKAVYDLSVALLAGTVEWGSAHYLARAIPTDYNTARRATDMGDNADALVGPPIQALWPELPKGAQQLLIRIADHSDLIACAFAWSDYIAELRKFAATESAKVEAEDSEGVNYGNQTEAISVVGLQPFQPVQD